MACVAISTVEGPGAPGSALQDLHLTLLGNRFGIEAEMGQTAESSGATRRTLDPAERAGSYGLGRLRIHAAELAYSLGRWDDALAELEAADSLNADRAALRHGVAALIHGHRDDWRQAKEHFEGLTRQLCTDRVRGCHADAGTVPVAALVLQSERLARPRQALELLACGLEPRAGSRMPHRYELLPTTVRLALDVGDQRLARAAAEFSAQEAHRVPTIHTLAAADWSEGLMRGDPAAIAAAAGHLRDVALPLQAGNALEDAAVVHARGGDGTAARATLAEAQEVYEAIGAAWDTRRAVARLRANGVRLGTRGPRKRPRYGRQALTAMERKVAELAADGHLNPDIAAYLHMSRRTVESHISHILTKLSITSRHEIKSLIQGDACRHFGSTTVDSSPDSRS